MLPSISSFVFFFMHAQILQGERETWVNETFFPGISFFAGETTMSTFFFVFTWSCCAESMSKATTTGEKNGSSWSRAKKPHLKRVSCCGNHRRKRLPSFVMRWLTTFLLRLDNTRSHELLFSRNHHCRETEMQCYLLQQTERRSLLAISN